MGYSICLRGLRNTQLGQAARLSPRARFLLIDQWVLRKDNDSVCYFLQFAMRGDYRLMNDFNRKVHNASTRVNQTIDDATERVEKEAAEFIKYLNEEVVPAVRQHSTKALRVAAEKLQELANYMEQHSSPRK